MRDSAKRAADLVGLLGENGSDLDPSRSEPLVGLEGQAEDSLGKWGIPVHRGEVTLVMCDLVTFEPGGLVGFPADEDHDAVLPLPVGLMEEGLRRGRGFRRLADSFGCHD